MNKKTYIKPAILAAHEIWINTEGREGKRAYLVRANLLGADLQEVILVGANLLKADLSNANLRDAKLEGADLLRADLVGANLLGADLEKANLIGANLTEANLSHADLRRADLRGADLRGADLEGVDLRKADLRGAEGIKILELKGDQHEILFSSSFSGFQLQIGCFIKSIEDWEKEYISLAEEYNYKEKEINEIKEFVSFCQNFFKE